MSDRDASNNGVLTLQVPRPTVMAVSEKFPEGVVVLVCPPEELKPEFIRLPDGSPGSVCPVTGLSRSALMGFIQDSGAQVKVRHLRKRGATRGVDLIDRASLVAYVNSQPAPAWCRGGDGEKGYAGALRHGDDNPKTSNHE